MANTTSENFGALEQALGWRQDVVNHLDGRVTGPVSSRRAHQVTELLVGCGVVDLGRREDPVAMPSKNGLYLLPVPEGMSGIIPDGCLALADTPPGRPGDNVIYLPGRDSLPPLKRAAVLGHETLHVVQTRELMERVGDVPFTAIEMSAHEAEAHQLSLEIYDLAHGGLLGRVAMASSIELVQGDDGHSNPHATVDSRKLSEEDLEMLNRLDQGDKAFAYVAGIAHQFNFDPSSNSTPPAEMVELYRQIGIIDRAIPLSR